MQIFTKAQYEQLIKNGTGEQRVGRRAVAGKIVTPVDRRGFIAANWKAVE